MVETHSSNESSKRRSVAFADDEVSTVGSRHKSPPTADGHLSFEPPQFNHAEEEAPKREGLEHRQASIEMRHVKRGSIECAPMSQWQSLAPCVVPKMQLAPIPVVNKVAVAHSSTMELTRFQRFIRRMERAGSKTILERLQEDWQEASGEEPDEQVSFKIRGLGTYLIVE